LPASLIAFVARAMVCTWLQNYVARRSMQICMGCSLWISVS